MIDPFHKLRVFALLLFVLLVLGFVIWRLNLAHEINLELAAIRAAGLPTNGQEANDYYPAVPDDKNAALKMQEAFGLMTNFPDRRSNEVDRVRLPGRKAVLTAEETELITGYIAINSNALGQVPEAIKLPRCRYPIDLRWGAGTLLPHLPKLKALARAEVFRAVIDPNGSGPAIATMLGIARTLDDEPDTVAKLVRMAIINMAVSVLERHLNASEIDAKESKDLEETLVGADQTNQLANGFIGERALYIRYFRMSFADINKFANSSDENSESQSGPPLPGSQPLIIKVSGFFERDLRFYLQAMETNVYFAKTYPKNISVITNCEAGIEDSSRRHIYILSSMLLPALSSAIFREASELAGVRTAEAALAVEGYREQNGRLPANLNELVPQFIAAVPQDPFDGQPLRYHRLDKGYVVYSVGRDGHDNGGRERPVSVKSSDKTEYDVTFTVER
jgi:hypothetical protein